MLFCGANGLMGDPVADAVITSILAENQKGELDQIFQMLVRNRQFPNPAFDALPDPVKGRCGRLFRDKRVGCQPTPSRSS